jgi:hypothetical protein
MSMGASRFALVRRGEDGASPYPLPFYFLEEGD